ncbi:MAG: VOC family protein [Oscillospiraceae bacterium]|nr:VOC family protein [Oscillospiraceae bacterium]
MKFRFAHNNFNVMDLEKSLAFYREALDLTEARRITAPDGSFIIVYLTDGVTPHLLELTWLRDWDKDHYDLGDDEFHLAFTVEDYDSALKKHREMGCVAMENEAMGIYFITDPDEYWLEILPAKR